MRKGTRSRLSWEDTELGDPDEVCVLEDAWNNRQPTKEVRSCGHNEYDPVRFVIATSTRLNHDARRTREASGTIRGSRNTRDNLATFANEEFALANNVE